MSAGGGCEAAVTVRTRCGCAKRGLIAVSCCMAGYLLQC